MKPSIGRIVHAWVRFNGWDWRGPYAAIITGVKPDEPWIVDLSIFRPGFSLPDAAVAAPPYRDDLKVSEADSPTHDVLWDWPPRTE